MQYLQNITEKVQELVNKGAPESALRDLDIESCGKSRVPLDGLVQHLHRENLAALYEQFKAAEDPGKKSHKRPA
jgi:hypothetical protein